MLGSLLAAAPVVAAMGGPAAASERSDLLWKLAWSSPTTSQGPNPFTAPVEIQGTVTYALGKVDHVAATISTDADLPKACGTFPATTSVPVVSKAFSVEPDLACNGTYHLSVVGQSGSGMLAAHSPALTAPFTLADPGPAPSGFTGVVEGATRSVTVSWSADHDPDVVGYRVRRNGAAVADVPAGERTHTDTTPSAGTFSYDVETLRWGAGGPGEALVASPPTAPLIAQVVPDAPPVPVVPTGPAGGGGGSSGHGSSGSSAPGAGSHAVPSTGHAVGHLPALAGAHASVTDRSGYRSGGIISPSVPTTTLDDGYSDHLPYQAKTTTRPVDLAGPDGTKTVSSTVSVPSRRGMGLLVPVAVVVVLLAASLQVRGLVGRAGALARAGAGDGDDLALDGPDPLDAEP